MPSSPPLSATDRALISALAAWAGPEALPLLRHFGPDRSRTLARAYLDRAEGDPLGQLRESRTAQANPDPARVHPSWFVRALQGESPAVQRVVIAEAPEPLRSTLLARLGVDPADLAPDRPAVADARLVALTLWTERLVGDVPDRAEDPPAIVAITTLGPTARYRVARLCGLAKRSTLPGKLAGRSGGRSRALAAKLNEPVDPRLVAIGEADLAASATAGRHAMSALGAITLGRLLARADPYRIRWALQHLPYPVAKRLRAASTQSIALSRAVEAWEGRFLDAALALIAEEPAGPARSTSRAWRFLT